MNSSPSSQRNFLPPGDNELCYRCGHKLILMTTPAHPHKVGLRTYYICDRCHVAQAQPGTQSGWARPLPVKASKAKVLQSKPKPVEDIKSPVIEEMLPPLRYQDDGLARAVALLPTLETPKSLKETPKSLKEPVPDIPQ